MGNIVFAVFMLGIVALILYWAVRGFHIQHEGHIGVIESWGRFAHVAVAGRHIIWPWERVVAQLPLQIFEWATPPQKLMVKGGGTMTLSAVIHYQIQNAHKTPGAPRPARIIGTVPPPVGTPALAMAGPAASPMSQAHSYAPLGVDSLEPGARSQVQRRTPPGTVTMPRASFIQRVLGHPAHQLDITQAAYRAQYVVHHWEEATKKEAVAGLQQVFSKVGVGDDIVGNVDWYETLGERVREHLNQKTEAWGVEIVDVTFTDVTLPEMTLQNLHAEPRSEREGRIRTKEAENYQRIAEILHLTPTELLRWRQIEIMRELAKAPQPRVMFTTDSMNRISDLPLPVQQATHMMPASGPDPGEPPAPAPTLRGYLGSEPPLPALPPLVQQRETSQ